MALFKNCGNCEYGDENGKPDCYDYGEGPCTGCLLNPDLESNWEPKEKEQ